MAKAVRVTHIGDFDNAPRPVAAAARSYADGAATPFHKHHRGQLLHARSGIMRIETADATWLVPPARALWMPPALPHKVTMRGQVEMRTLYIAPASCVGLPPRPTLVEVSGLLRELILAALEEPPDYEEAARGGQIARLILTELSRLRQRPLELPMPVDRRTLKIARSLLERPDIADGLDGWAAQAGASRRTLARLFRAETGLSFAEWRARLRALDGLARLSAGSSVATAAAAVGYGSASAFTAMVRRSLGSAPRSLSREG